MALRNKCLFKMYLQNITMLKNLHYDELSSEFGAFSSVLFKFKSSQLTFIIYYCCCYFFMCVCVSLINLFNYFIVLICVILISGHRMLCSTVIGIDKSVVKNDYVG